MRSTTLCAGRLRIGCARTRQLALDGRRHAAVAIVLVDSDLERHDVDPVQELEIDWAEVPGYPWDAAESARLDGG